MLKYLITGFNGFVSSYFLDMLNDQDVKVSVLGLDRNEISFDLAKYSNLSISTKKLNLLETKEIYELLKEYKPNYIVHLASLSSVSQSWDFPADCFINNTNIFLNIIENVRILKLDCRILSIGSSEEYGKVDPKNLPLVENSVLNPISPYAVARVSQEMLSKIYAEKLGLDIVMTRSFNHTGFGQNESFVIPSFIRKIQKAKEQKIEEIEVGDISIIRDFLDVRDVVKAYYLLLKNGRRGEIYNVCSNRGYALKEILDIICEILDYKVEYVQVEKLLRPADNPVIIGSNKKMFDEFGWTSKIELTRSIYDIINKN